MPPNSHTFTSESVSMGHPDKMADQISDAVLDAMLAVDPTSRVACETLVTTGLAVVAGEVTCGGYVDIPKITRETVLRIGYDSADKGFDGRSCGVLVTLGRQSPDIARGVDTKKSAAKRRDQGAGDQGMMFGYACRDTRQLMPLPIMLSHRLVARQAEVRREEIVRGLRPDAKSQVAVEFEGRTPKKIVNVVLSTQHDSSWNASQGKLHDEILKHVIKPVLGDWWHDGIKVFVNPTGRFEIGGPHGDCGLTGRKIIVDTYGGRGRHGGGAFSGKDPSKVDRSAAYMARYVAKNIVAADLAEICEVQLAYAIGVARPTSVLVDTHGSGKIPDERLARVVEENFDLTPFGIIETLDLLRPIYSHTAYHGHFGREPDECGKGTFTWERTNVVSALRKSAVKARSK
ncbi:MAG: methionine adenosyltransferase [Phycisphaerales bacterium]|nr:methionine adenosyltransferase [Phycisphaerales bacterium]